MAKRYTKKNHEVYLNELYGEMGWSYVFRNLQYLTKIGWLLKAYKNKRIGSLLRKNDPVAFQVSYRDRTPKY